MDLNHPQRMNHKSQKQSFRQHHSKTSLNSQKKRKNYNRTTWSLTKKPFLLNFRSLSVNIDKPGKGGTSGPCGHCALCGSYGQHRNSIVMLTTIIKTDNETIKLKQNLTLSKLRYILGLPYLMRQNSGHNRSLF